LDDVAIAENNVWRQWQDWDEDRIKLQREATKTTMTTMKGVDDHNKEDPPKGGKHARRVKTRRRD
jgi:hypothetical protein